MACPPPEFNWSSWATWSCLREDLAPILTFVGAAIVAWAALTQARTARRRHEEQTKADLERRITESFAKAVEQLGSDKLATRLGGIYTLERLSRESEREYWPIMETLTAYVREHAPWPPRPDEPPDPQKAPNSSREKIRPETDVHAILKVLGRRMRYLGGLDLSGTDLRGAYLRNAYLRGAFLKGACLEGANLTKADLKYAFLEDARLKGANLGAACLMGASLRSARGLTKEQINSAHGDENTTLPEGLERPALWTKR